MYIYTLIYMLIYTLICIYISIMHVLIKGQIWGIQLVVHYRSLDKR